MPEAVENELPRGREQGAAQETEEFIQQTAPSPNPVVPVTPQAFQQTFEVQEEPDPETPGENLVELDDGPLNLDELLFGPTQRPDESVTMGIPGIPAPPQRVSGVLEGLVQRGFASTDVQHLLNIAKNLDL